MAKVQCKMHCCLVGEELGRAIRESAEATRGCSMFDGELKMFGPMCRCGIHRKPPGLAKYVEDDGRCTVHPDAPIQPWTRGAEAHGRAGDQR